MAKKQDFDNRNKNNSSNGGHQYFNLEDKAIFDEVDEELKNEKFKQLINKYGGAILTFIVLVLAITVGYERISEWKISKAENKNIAYTKAITPSTNYENNIVELENIVHTETGIYRDFAQLNIANILIENNQTNKGIEVLNKIVQDETFSPRTREIAAIKVATYKVDSASYNDIKTLIGYIAENPNSAWQNMAKELLAMSAIQAKDYETAKGIYNNLLSSDISDDFRVRVNDMLALVNEASQSN